MQIDIIPVLKDRYPQLLDNYIYVLTDADSDDVAVVDPGIAEPVFDYMQEHDLSPTHILTTHHHWDHTNGVKGLKKRYGCEIVGSAYDAERIPAIDTALEEGDSYSVCGTTFAIIHNPGHTTGGISYYAKTEKVAFVGDTLFAMGCGRMFEGNPPQFLHSLRKLASLPDDTAIYTGHEYAETNAAFAVTVEPENQALQLRKAEIGALRADGKPSQPTTIGQEKQTNPFLRTDSPEIRERLGLKSASDEAVFAELRARKDAF